MKKSITSRASYFLAGSLVIVIPSLPVAAADFQTPTHCYRTEATDYYVALGDSLAVGVQVVDGSRVTTDKGYADDLYAIAKKSNPRLELVKLGCGGETTGTMIAGDPGQITDGCPRTHGSQLNDALAFINAHPGHIKFVTIDIGLNDVLEGVDFSVIAANLTTILVELRQAAGPNIPIVGANYFDPFLGFAYDSGGLPGLQNELQAANAFDGFLDDLYTAQGMPYADMLTAFHANDTHLVHGTPLDVKFLCQWTYVCTVGDTHPNSTGYSVMADAFAIALGFPGEFGR